MKAIEIKKLWFRYDEESKVILKNINVTFEYGKMYLIAGDSGSGKSTFISLLNGEIPNYKKGQMSGEILINGESIDGKSIAFLAKNVGSVLQNADAQIANEIVEDEIAFGMENIGKAPTKMKSTIEDLCQRMQLDPNAKTKVLSGGQKQRLITASTLAMGQKIVVLDEPLANLDVAGSLTLLKELQRLAHEEGYLVIIVEHRLDLIQPFLNQAYILKNCELSLMNYKNQVDQISVSKKEKQTKLGDEILVVKDMSYSVKGKEILKNINLTIRQNERILLIGENGCGKTTLSKLLAKLIKPTSGSIQTSLTKRNRANKKWFRKIGYIYQNPNYQLFLSKVEDEINFACKDYVFRDYLIEKLKLKDILFQHPFSLSEGQKRKVTVAAILTMKPKLLFLDEPTVGQDEESLKNLVDCVNHLNQINESTTITITHDLRCAKALCNRVLWIKDHVIYKDGGHELIDEFFGGMKND